MNKKLSYNITENITAHNNIDIDLGLSFDPLSYVVDMPDNMKKYINENMLLMNIEDVDSIYNIFDHRRVSYAYQTSNVLFINSNQDIYPLNYNLENLSYFSISYHDINLNLLDRTFVGVNGFSYQTIFSYNSSNYSYIYSDDDKLQTISYTTQGIYKIDDDNIKLEGESLTINTTKFKYNNANINTFVNKTNNVIKQYKDNDPIYFVKDNDDDKFYENKFIEITDRNVSVKRKIKFQENQETSCEFIKFIIKDTDWFIIDIPVVYWYKSILTKNFEYSRKLCPITINGGNNVGDLNVDILDIDNTNTIFNKLIGVDYNKSFIHNNKCLSLKYDSSDEIFKLTDSCNISLYFHVNEDIYDYVYNLDDITQNEFNIDVNIQFSDTLYKFKFKCVVDVMNRLFKKLYHNYNYGFNFDNHGKCVGLLYLQKSSDSLIKTQQENESIEKINEFRLERQLAQSLLPISYLSNANYSYISANNEYINIFDINDYFYSTDKNDIKTINKDTFVNFDLESLDNIIVENKNIDHNKISIDIDGKFMDEVICIDFDNNSPIITTRKYNNNIKYPETLKQRDFNILYKNDHPTINIYNDNSGLYLNPVFIDTKFGNLKLLKIPNLSSAEKCLNNHYIMNYNSHKEIFNDIYNYHKTGFLKGDFYTPCVQDYILFNLFNIKNYLNYKLYKEFVEKLRGNIKFLTNQFKQDDTSSILYQYVIDNNENNYQLNTYSSVINKKSCYIWPVFMIPDYSIINSNDYMIIYNENDNCEYIDYYISTLERTTIIYINCRVYFKTNNLNLNNFEIYNEDFEKITHIKITEANLIDRNNDIYQLSIYIEPSDQKISVIEKINKFYICFKDSEPYLNHKKINDDTYRRILCKVYVKNDGI